MPDPSPNSSNAHIVNEWFKSVNFTPVINNDVEKNEVGEDLLH